MEYRIDTGGDGSIMPCNISKILFPKETVEWLAKHSVVLWAYKNKHQWEACSATIKLNIIVSKYYAGFFAVPGGGPALFGMPDIKTLDILRMKENTIKPRGQSQEIN